MSTTMSTGDAVTRPSGTRVRRPGHVVAGFLLACALAGGLGACSDEPERAAPSTVPDGTELAPGLSLVAGSGFGATPWETGGERCSPGGRIVTEDRDDIHIATWAPECVVAEGLNGTYQRYNSVADVVDAHEVATERVTAGTAHVFDQIYTECTNSCTDFTHRILLLELDEPVQPDLPTAMISTTGEASMDELIAIADAIRTSA